ncbi:DNA primase, partial [Klebsiella oxytoca]
ETVDEFQIGFSPAKRNSLQLYLNTIEDINVDRELLTSTGIFSENNDDEEAELLDRFSNRIIFPIRDFYGNIAGFSGRDFQKDSDSNGYKRAKYLNSPETEYW